MDLDKALDEPMVAKTQLIIYDALNPQKKSLLFLKLAKRNTNATNRIVSRIAR
jgi:hypothetical protein